MSETIGWGCSLLKNPNKAGQEAARSALDMINKDACHSCVVFSTVGYNAEILLKSIKAEVGNIAMVGCSGAGCISPGIADESNHCVIVGVIADPLIRMDTAGLSCIGDSETAGHTIGKDLKQHMKADTRCVMLFPSGLNTLAEELMAGMEEHLGRELPFIGGFAADNLLREKTYQYHDWQIYTDGIAAALLSGDFFLVTDVTHGCMPIGTQKEITKANGNRIYEIDHKPVMDVIVEYVGEEIKEDFGKISLHFCIGQKTQGNLSKCYDPFIIRYIIKHHPEDGSISLPVKFKKGDKVWVARRDHEKMLKAARNSIENLKQAVGNNTVLMGFHFDCVGRGRLVFSEQDKLSLVSSFRENMAPESPWLGFFTYGEFCPVGERNVFHNYSAALALLCREGLQDG